jgi:hypothetical protein
MLAKLDARIEQFLFSPMPVRQVVGSVSICIEGKFKAGQRGSSRLRLCLYSLI